ncbi:MAG: 4Fe-4S dicluster domain-containing protein [Candidatus Helarchaeota archaeon]
MNFIKNKRDRIIELINELRKKDIHQINSIKVPEGLKGFGTIKLIEENCIACAACARICKSGAIKIKEKYHLNEIIEKWKRSKASNRKDLAELLESLKNNEKILDIPISSEMIGYGEIEILPEKCVFCLDCIKVCGFDALEPELTWDLRNILLNSI